MQLGKSKSMSSKILHRQCCTLSTSIKHGARKNLIAIRHEKHIKCMNMGKKNVKLLLTCDNESPED